jgi:hypothetical protein
MPLLLFEKETDTKARVVLVHYMPDDPKEGLPEDVRAQGIMVDNLPELPLPQRGKTPVLYCNPQTLEVWYELVDRPLTQEEMIQEQNEKIDLLIRMQFEKEGVI